MRPCLLLSKSNVNIAPVPLFFFYLHGEDFLHCSVWEMRSASVQPRCGDDDSKDLSLVSESIHLFSLLSFSHVQCYKADRKQYHWIVIFCRLLKNISSASESSGVSQKHLKASLNILLHCPAYLKRYLLIHIRVRSEERTSSGQKFGPVMTFRWLDRMCKMWPVKLRNSWKCIRFYCSLDMNFK